MPGMVRPEGHAIPQMGGGAVRSLITGGSMNGGGAQLHDPGT